MNRILITGANGFIGQALCKRLMESEEQRAEREEQRAESKEGRAVLLSKLILQPIIIKPSYPFQLKAVLGNLSPYFLPISAQGRFG